VGVGGQREMNQQFFTDAFIFLLSGSAKIKNKQELHWEDKRGDPITIEFPTQTPRYAIVRRYWKNKDIRTRSEYRDGKLHGKAIDWYEDGSKHWEREYRDGELHGSFLLGVGMEINGGM